jgi:hypothetical protein
MVLILISLVIPTRIMPDARWIGRVHPRLAISCSVPSILLLKETKFRQVHDYISPLPYLFIQILSLSSSNSLQQPKATAQRPRLPFGDSLSILGGFFSPPSDKSIPYGFLLLLHRQGNLLGFLSTLALFFLNLQCE